MQNTTEFYDTYHSMQFSLNRRPGVVEGHSHRIQPRAADGSIDPARLTPRTAGFGAATGAMDMRTVQMQIRFRF